MSSSIQSSNYVPGVSGWKLNFLTDEFEINGSSITVGSLPSDPQPISITAGEWSEYDLPSNAIERYAFIGAELAKVPAEYRESAEFKTEDASFDCDGSDYRTTLTYVRLETLDEAKARHEKAKVAGTRIVRAGGCTTGIVDGVVRWRFGDLSAPVDIEPFKVVDGVTYVSEKIVDEGTITKTKIASNWSIRLELTPGGHNYAAGLGLGAGIGSNFIVTADRFAVNGRDASEILRDIVAQISETELCRQVLANTDQLGSSLADQVKELIRKELMPGGLLHRSR